MHRSLGSKRGYDDSGGHLKAEMDALWDKAEMEGLENDFMEFLEDEYNLYDFDRARDIIREEGL